MLAASLSLRGRVVDPGGQPVGGAAVRPLLADGGHVDDVRTRLDDGSFEIELPQDAELASLYVAAEGYAPAWVVEADVRGAWDGVVIELGAGATIRGLVAGPDGPLARAQVEAWLHDPSDLGLAGGAMGSSAWVRSVTTDEDGVYVLRDVPRGTLALGVWLAEEGRARSLARIRNLRVEDDPLYLCDFELGGGCDVGGSIELPSFLEDSPLWLELHPRSGGPAVASLEALPGVPFVFYDVPVADGGAFMLRISIAPGFHVERAVDVQAPRTDVGVFRFASPESLLEFNRPDRQIIRLSR